MEKQSGFPTRRTDLSTRLRAMSELPKTSEKTEQQRRYDPRHYNHQQDKYELKRRQRTPLNRRHYHNKW